MLELISKNLILQRINYENYAIICAWRDICSDLGESHKTKIYSSSSFMTF